MNIDRNPSVTYGNFNAPQASVHRSCEELYNRVQKEKGGPPEMLMFFIKGKSAIMYEHIKQYCDTIKGIQSQVVDSFNAQKKGGDRAFHANLLLKMNSKLGGTTVTLQTPLVGPGFPTVYYLFGYADDRFLLVLMFRMLRPVRKLLVWQLLSEVSITKAFDMPVPSQ
jgi:hypothetical protein